jgi:hypothetical protein
MEVREEVEDPLVERLVLSCRTLLLLAVILLELKRW